MTDDGRLELDDGGLPIEGRTRDLVAAGPGGPSRAGRIVDAVLAGGAELPRWTRALIGAGLMAALVSALVISQRASPPPPASAAQVRGTSAQVLPRTSSSTAPQIVASYAIRPRPGEARSRIVGVTGAGITSAAETRSADVSDTQAFLITPDCERLLAPGEPPPYELLLASSDDSSHSSPTPVAAFQGADALTLASVRACWGSAASSGLSPISVTAQPGTGPWTSLDVVLRNKTDVAMSVTALDVANVDTLSMADARSLAPEETGTLRVRLPITRCSDGAAISAPGGLSWSVGSPGAAPMAFATTPITPAQTAAIAAAARHRCGAPPHLTVEVVSARAARDPRAIDERGVSTTLALKLATNAPRTVVLGDDASRLTADARPVFSGAVVRIGRTPKVVEVVWHTRCGSTAADDTLPVTTSVGSLTYSWSVLLRGTSLVALRDAACS